MITRAGQLAREHGHLPRGTVTVAVGLVVAALASYLYLTIAARAVGPADYGLIAVLWSMVYLGSGALSPLAQEVSRSLSARREAGVGGSAVLRRAAILGLLVVVAIAVAVVAVAWLGDGALLRGDAILVVALIASIGTQAIARLFGGALQGTARFRRYAWFVSLEGLFRLVLATVLVVGSVTETWPFAVALALAPLLAILPVRWGMGRITEPGPDAPWRELTLSLGALLASSLLAAALIYAPALLVEALSSPGERVQAGIFNAALVLTRAPLILFGAILIVLLPELSGHAAARRYDALVASLRRALVVIVVLLVIGSVAAFLVGAQVLSLLFGADFAADSSTIGVLTVGTSAIVIASTLALGLIALRVVPLAAVAWGLGLLVMIGSVAVLDIELDASVALAYAVGAIIAAVAMAAFLGRALRSAAADVVARSPH